MRGKESRGGISQWAEGRKAGAAGEKNRACHPPSAKPVPPSSPSLSHSSSPSPGTARPAISNPPCARVPVRACVCRHVFEWVHIGGEVGVVVAGVGEGRAIKALLKHFWCCWLMLQLEEGERKKRKRREEREKNWGKWESEGVRERVHTLSGEPGTPSGPLAACQYYEHGGARWVNNLIPTSNFHGWPRGQSGEAGDVCC